MKTIAALSITLFLAQVLHAQALPGTKLLEQKADWARVMVDGIDRYLDRATADSVKERGRDFKPDASSAEAFDQSVAPKRARLKHILGLVDERLPANGFEQVWTTTQPSFVTMTNHFEAFAVRWQVMPGITGEGLLLQPKDPPRGCVVVIPDTEHTPEQLAGLSPGLDPIHQIARRLAEHRFRVVVPVLIDRKDTWSGNPKIGRMTNQSHREFVWRMSYQMGRHILGYELQRVFAVVDRFAAETPKLPVGVVGTGTGGTLALFAAALDARIAATLVRGSFGPREKLHDEPIDHDVWNLLREFGDAEVAQMVQPRHLVVTAAELAPFPKNESAKGRAGAAPGKRRNFNIVEVRGELDRLPPLFEDRRIFVEGPKELDEFLRRLMKAKEFAARPAGAPLIPSEFDPAPRQKRQFDELVRHAQGLLPEAATKRQKHVWDRLDMDPARFEKSQTELRETFWRETIGKLPTPTKPPSPRTRLILETPKWKGYEVVLDLYDDVISYGILLVPNGIKPGERRPTIVCQHGLDGRPIDVVDPTKKTKYYNSFGAQLADRGYIVFAPQAPFIFRDDFRQTVRKMHPLGLTIYSFIVRQHEAILDFLETLPFVDGQRIALYGLSYGGKVAVRIPAILLRYAVVICSGDFNEWIWKNITLDWAGSYMFTGEYEMFEFNLGNTFNYAEMTALIAPRPFMVERGHHDGVGLDEYVAFEYAKTRRLYGRLGLASRTEIEFFMGGHEIRGEGTFAFLARHLAWRPAD